MALLASSKSPWSDDETSWSELPAPWPADALGFAHSDVVVSSNGDLITGHPNGAALLRITSDGVADTISLPITESHGMTLSHASGAETLWVADIGSKYLPDAQRKWRETGPGSGQVIQVDLAGNLLSTLPPPVADAYSSSVYMPTAVAVSNDGEMVWVADGYGAGLVHLFTPDGGHTLTISGEESDAGRLNCPHSIFIDERHGDPELYVTDRANNRIVVYDLDATFKRVVGAGELLLPSALASYGEFLVVVELQGRLTVLDHDDRMVARLGDNIAGSTRLAWPNRVDEQGLGAAPEGLRANQLNSPHGLAINASGQLMVSEWLIGGRLISVDPRKDGRA